MSYASSSSCGCNSSGDSSSTSSSSGSSSSSSPSPRVALGIDGLTDAESGFPGGLVIKRIYPGPSPGSSSSASSGSYNCSSVGASPRKRINLEAHASGGYVTLIGGSSKIRVFESSTGTDEVYFDGYDNKWEVSGDWYHHLWVEGAQASDQMRDVTLTLTHDAGPSDSVNFTVLWVTVSAKNGGQVSDDNAKRDVYYNSAVPETYALGHHLYASDDYYDIGTGTVGRGSEFIGEVAPPDFAPAEFDGTLKMTQEVVSARSWWGPNGKENSDGWPPGSDEADPFARDDDPQPNGKIYSFDTPGLHPYDNVTAGLIMRARLNLCIWAKYNDVSCSSKKPWYTRQSYKLTGSADYGTASASSPTTLTDDSKAWAPGSWAPGVIHICGGTGSGQTRTITDATATTITVANEWHTQPDSTSQYRVVNTATWTQHNDVANDNESGDGWTKTSWDLQ